MPEPIEQPTDQPIGQPVEPITQAPVAALVAGASAAPKAESAMSLITKKYRLDGTVKINSLGADGKPLGVGPMIDREVVRKLSSLDKTRGKKYLDWMLYQAGGGDKAFKESVRKWDGNGKPELDAVDYIRRFKAEESNVLRPIDVEDVAASKSRPAPQILALTNEIVQASRAPGDAAKFSAMVELLKQSNRVPGAEERCAGELLSIKLKRWSKKQYETQTRDRVHMLYLWGKVLRGMELEEAEQKWKTVAAEREREYIFGDEDSARSNSFGFSRHWPGHNNCYERVYNVMGEFLAHKAKLEKRNETIDQWNAAVEAKNQQLPPDQQLPLREPVNIPTDIGKVTLTPDMRLAYKGRYPTVESLVEANDVLADIPMRERIAGDVRYAGPMGKAGRNERLYSDSNLEVLVPLTVAASIKAGTPDWPVSDPEQMDMYTSSGHSARATWTQYHGGIDVTDTDVHGGSKYKRVPIMFHVKAQVPKGTDRLLMVTSIEELCDLIPPYMGVVFDVGKSGHMSRRDLVKYWKANLDPAVYKALVYSFAKAFKAVRKWGGGFDPSQVVADPVEYHRERMGMRRGFHESIRIRAAQTVELLLA